jgi:streptogramin lyase
MVASADGSIWVGADQSLEGSAFIGIHEHRIFKVEQSGVITSIRVQKLDELIGGIGGSALASDGSVWFFIHDAPVAEQNEFLRIPQTGSREIFKLPRKLGDSSIAITTGADGNIWFANEKVVGSVNSRGKFRFFKLPRKVSVSGMTQGPDGAIWISSTTYDGYVDSGSAYVYRVATNGKIRSIRTRPALGIVLGSDGNLWLPSWRSFQRLKPNGSVKQFPIAFPDASEPNSVGDVGREAYNAVLSPGGEMIYAATLGDPHGPTFSDSIGTMEPNGVATESFDLPELASLPAFNHMIVSGNGEIWVAGASSNKIQVLSLAPPTVHIPSRPQIAKISVRGHTGRAQIRCEGMAGSLCSGTVELRQRNHRIAGQSVTIAPGRISNIAFRIPRASKRALYVVKATSKDAILGTTSTASRKIRAK